ncbi:MAG: hypothetical protein ACI32C_05370 [Candidatus Enteromonas sp.]
MCFFKKKKKEVKEPVISSYEVGQRVGIIQKDFSSTPGVVHDIYLGPNKEVFIDVQVGGECPYVKKGLKENEIKAI